MKPVRREVTLSNGGGYSLPAIGDVPERAIKITRAAIYAGPSH